MPEESVSKHCGVQNKILQLPKAVNSNIKTQQGKCLQRGKQIADALFVTNQCKERDQIINYKLD